MAFPAEIVSRALERLREGTPYSVAAVFTGEITSNGLDGAMWRLCVSDGHAYLPVDAFIAGTYGGHRGMEIDPEHIEREVERACAGYAREERLERLAEASPIAIPAD